MDLVVKLWESILGVDRGVRDISNGSRFDHVSDCESLDGLVLRDTSGAVGASNWLGMTTSVLVSPVVSSLQSHDELCLVMAKVPGAMNQLVCLS